MAIRRYHDQRRQADRPVAGSSGYVQLIRLGLLRSQLRGPSEGAAAVDDLVLCLRSTRLSSTGDRTLISYAVAKILESDCLATAARIAPGLPAAERQRLAAAMERLPPMLEAGMALRGELEWIAGTITVLRTKPILERMKLMGGNEFAIESILKIGLLSDDAIDRTLRQIAEITEIAGPLDMYYQKPVATRMTPFKPVFQGGAEVMTPLLEQYFFPNLEHLTTSEAMLVTTRQQFAAALAFLDQGEAGLAAHPDPFTGKPFTLVQDGAFRRLVATSPALGNPLDLWIGPRPPDGATSPAAADEPNQDAEPNSRF